MIENQTPIPALVHQMEVCLRSGYNIRQTLEIAAKDLPEPLATEIRQTLADLDGGTALPTALEHWLDRAPSPDLDWMLATIKVQLEVGGNLADKFRLLGQMMEKRRGI
ncbi:MAG: type II secretion system F family protein [Anaerolineales bacterium]|jgi:tight adherence protein B|nr:type II secretion system F family protein [Anaerolineales bacterium]